MSKLSRSLKAIGACEEAVTWAKDYETLHGAWKACHRGDWMLWLCGKMLGRKGWPTRQEVVLAACDCAELSLPLFEKKHANDKRPRNAIETAREWANGKATIAEVRDAAHDAAHDAAYAAAHAAAYAAYTAHAAHAAAEAAHAAADAADAADAAHAAHAARLRECADICRKRLKIYGSISEGK